MSTSEGAFLDARLTATRLVTESVTSGDGAPGTPIQNLQLQVVTESSFNVGLDKPLSPTALILSLDFGVRLLQQESQHVLVEYKARHAAHFVIRRHAGFSDWTLLPGDALSPYLSILLRIAIARAEGTVDAIGIKGVRLPVAEDFADNLSQTPADRVSASA